MGVTSVIKDYGTELLNAIRDNDLKTFKTTCEKYLKHDSQIAELCTMDIKHRPTKKFACPLILAARLEDPSIIKYMLEVGVNPNFVHHTVSTSRHQEILTPLHIAVDMGYTKTIEALVAHNADPNIPDHIGETPLLIATKKSDWVAMRMLLAKGGNPKITDKLGNAPLHIATLYGHLQMVKTLLKHDADIHQKGNMGAIPSHIAAKEGHIHLVQVYCSNDNGLINTRIPCFADKRDKGLMHLAAEHGHAETVVALIDQFNADVNLRDSNGNTPLHCVVLHNYHPYKMRDKDYFYATAKILVKYKAAINEKNSNGETALHLAAAHNHPKIVELLLNVGANAFAENNDRLKPIDVVPETDTVSKQLLKTAMINPKPPLNASSLSLVQNSSFHIGLPINALHTSMNKSYLTNINGSKQALLMSDSTRINRSFKPPNDSLNSSTSTIVMHKMKNGNLIVSPHLPRHKIELLNQSYKHNLGNSSIQKYNGYDKYNYQYNHQLPYKHSSKRRQSSFSNINSSLSSSMHDLSKSYYRDRHRHRSRKDYSTDESSIIHEKPSKSHRRYKSSDSRQILKTRKTVEKRNKNNFYYSSDESIEQSEQKEKIKRKHTRSHKSLNLDNSRTTNDGIRVHTIPGKLSTVEVEYARGPITIEIEKQEPASPLNKEYQKVSQAVKKKHRQQKRPDINYGKIKAHKVNSNKMNDNDNSKEFISDWYETMKSYNKHIKNAPYDSDDVFTDKEYDDESVLSPSSKIVDNLQSNVENEEHKKVKKNKKREQRLSKQQIFDEQLEMERMPVVDPEPPHENLEVEMEDDIMDESSVNSDSLEEEINETQRILNESASRRISEVMDSIRSNKWSEDEYGQTPEEWSSITKTPLEEHNVNKSKKIKNNFVQQEDMNNKNQINEIYTTNLIENNFNTTIRLETLNPKKNNSNSINNFTKTNSVDNESVEDEELSDEPNRKKSLNIRVSGETPKAYTRRDKLSARSQFIQAAPVKIESSSEASDSELNLSRASLQELDANSLKRRTEWSKPLVPVQSKSISKGKKALKDNINTLTCKNIKTHTGPKPYKSFGNIETKTDALNEALRETNSVVNLSTASTAIIPDLYKIKKPSSEIQKKSNEYSVDDSTSDDLATEQSYEVNKYKDSNINTDIADVNNVSQLSKHSIDDLLEIYSEEPLPRHKRDKIITDKSTRKSLETDFSNENLNENNSDLDKVVDVPQIVTERKNKFKKEKKKNFVLPEGLSPEVWEEASKNAPLASSDTFSDISIARKEKSKGKIKHYNIKTKDNDSIQTIEWDTSTDISKYKIDLDTLGLDVCIPVAQDHDISLNNDRSNGSNDLQLRAKPDVKRKEKKIKVNDKYVEVVTTDIIEKSETQIDSTIEKIRPKTNIKPEINKKDTIIYTPVQFAKPKPSVKKNKPPKPDKTIPVIIETSLYKKFSGKPKYYVSENEADVAYDLNLKPHGQKTKQALPKYPHRPYDIHRMSDSEGSPKRHYRAYYTHSEAEASDYEPPDKPGPGMSYKQAALNSINAGMRMNQHKSFLLRQPGHHDKNFNYLLKLYRPPRGRRCRSRHLLPSAGKYGENELRRVMSNQSFTESEGEVDKNRSFISDDLSDQEFWNGSTQSFTAKIDNPVYQSLMQYRKLKQLREEMKKNESKPIASLEPDAVNLEKYDDIARIWLEQVDSKTVQKSNMMYLSILPEGRNIPYSLYSGSNFEHDKKYNDIMPQWVMARSRVNIKRSSGDQLSESMLEHDASRLSFNRHLVLFFKIGYNWMELAWILFDGLLRKSQVVRLIKDIQLKHPNNLTDQITDLMQRWWHKKGDNATIQELQKALDLTQMFYIQEEILNDGSPATSKFQTAEDILDTGMITTDDPNVSRISHEYNTRSLNASFVSSTRGAKHIDELSADEVLKKIQQSKLVPVGMNEILTRVGRSPSRSESRDDGHDDNILDRSPSKIYEFAGTTNISEDPIDVVKEIKEDRSTTHADIIVLKKKKKKPYKHETNL